MAGRRDEGGAAGLDLRPSLGCFSTAVGSGSSVDRDRGRVTAAEIAELLRFERRLRHRGEDATCAEWVAFFEAKANMLDRIASDPNTLADRTESRRAAGEARDEADRLRAEAADWSWC
jgi:hypothetical protein